MSSRVACDNSECSSPRKVTTRSAVSMRQLALTDTHSDSAQQIPHQQEAVDSAQTFLKLDLGRYATGIDPYIDVVTAQTTLLTNQQSPTNLQVQEMTASLQLIESLGGRLGPISIAHTCGGRAETEEVRDRDSALDSQSSLRAMFACRKKKFTSFIVAHSSSRIPL